MTAWGDQSQGWEAFDPATPALAVVPPAKMRGDTAPSVVSDLVPFWHPAHPLFAFGLLVAGTAGALYFVNEHGGAGARAGGKAHIGRASAGAGAELEV